MVKNGKREFHASCFDVQDEARFGARTNHRNSRAVAIQIRSLGGKIWQLISATNIWKRGDSYSIKSKSIHSSKYSLPGGCLIRIPSRFE